ncbi:unnamed protein product [Closterium sp. Naga37s-1]|nr:unnamed protein product [Closterium sp. Naga37s-1]
MSSFPPHVCLSPPPLPLHASSLPLPCLPPVPPSHASLPCPTPIPPSHASLPFLPPMPPSHASLPCLVPTSPSHASLSCLAPMPRSHASLPCLAPMPRSHASTIAGCACNLRSAFNDQGEASGGGRGGRESMERVEHAGVEEAGAACGGHSCFVMPFLRLNLPPLHLPWHAWLAVFKWWGFPNDVVASLNKKQFDQCNFTIAILLHSTTWVGRYKIALPSGTTRVLFASSMHERCRRGLKYDTGAILP